MQDNHKPTSAGLRHAIDSGQTRDKVAVEDPAAAPLGTDAEAGGAPPSPAEIAEAMRNEIVSGPARRPSALRALLPLIVAAAVLAAAAGATLLFR